VDDDYAQLGPGDAISATLATDSIDTWLVDLPEAQRLRIELRSPPGGAAAWLGLDAGAWATSRWCLAGIDTALTATLPAGLSRVTVAAGPGGRPGVYELHAMSAPAWPPALPAPQVVAGNAGHWLIFAPPMPGRLAGTPALNARWWIADRGWIASTPVLAGLTVPLAFAAPIDEPGRLRVRVQWYAGDLPAWPVSDAVMLPVSESAALVGVN
jgi:hypothetical protein